MLGCVLAHLHKHAAIALPVLHHPVYTVAAASDVVLMLALAWLVCETVKFPVGNVVLPLAIEEELEKLLLIDLVVCAKII